MLQKHKLLLPRWWSTLTVKPTQPIKIKPYFLLGLILLAAFTLQEVYQWRWAWLTTLQTDNVYKQLSGLILILYLACQWECAVLRTKGLTHEAAQLLNRHKWYGATAPLFFYAHAQQLGFAYLQALSLVYFAVFLTGLFNYENSHIHKPWFRPLWITLHIGLSTGLLVLVSYHIFISYSYE